MIAIHGLETQPINKRIFSCRVFLKLKCLKKMKKQRNSQTKNNQNQFYFIYLF